MKRLIIWPAAFLFLALAVPAHAITVDEVIGLTRAEAKDAVIMAKIEADGTVFRLTVDEILELKEAGVSDAVITFMINTGKVEPGLDDVDQVPEEMAEENPEADVPDTEYVEDDDGDGVIYVRDLDDRYRTDVVFRIGLGYYYPHWTGYYWSYYYDPFYWTAWPYYWAYWHPYPYWSWYYDPWYACNAYPYGYYYSWYGGNYTHHHAHRHYYDGYDGRYYADKGDRNIGNRGQPKAPRVIKGSNPAPRAETSYRQRTPKTDMTSNVRQPDYTQTRVKPPRSVQNPRTTRVVRSTPAPSKQVRSSDRSNNRRTVRSEPVKSKVVRRSPTREVKSTPAPSREKKQVHKNPPTKVVRQKSPAPAKVKAAPSGGNKVRSERVSKSSSRGSSRGSASKSSGSRNRKP